MSAGPLPKCCGFTALSASVILPSFAQIGEADCMKNGKKSPKIPYSAMVKNGKATQNRHHQNSVTSRRSSVALRPLPQSPVRPILLTDRMTDRQNKQKHNPASLGGIIKEKERRNIESNLPVGTDALTTRSELSRTTNCDVIAFILTWISFLSAHLDV